MRNIPDLNSLPPAERAALVDLMMPYITDAVVAAHTKIVHFGEETFIGHGAYVEELEKYLVTVGGERFVPLPAWDPVNPVPEEFNVVKARDDGTERPALVNLNPNMPLPGQFIAPRLCDYTDADTLGNEINPWHIHVHTTVGGALGLFTIASSAPIFWNFHVFVGDVYREWLRTCQTRG